MRIVSLFLASFIILFVPSITLAEDQSTTNTTYKEKRMEIKTEVKQKIDTRKAETKENREEVKEKLSALRQEKVRSMFGKMIVRVEATIERLTKLSEKLEDRIVKNKENKPDFNTAPATEKVNQAKVLLATSKTDLESIKNKVNTLVSADDPKVIFEEIRTDFEKVKSNLKEVHKFLVEAVKNLKTERKEMQ